MDKSINDVKSYRMEIGYLLIMELEKNEELPLPNRARLCKIMNEYFIKKKFVEKIEEDGYSWEPGDEYWSNHLSELCEYMRKEYKLYFAFIRNDGEFTGLWKWSNKGEWERSLIRDHQDISTRVDNHNEKVQDTTLRWNTTLPMISEVKRITN